MSNNPLEALYRQPKIYITLPSKNAFYSSDLISGDADKLPVYGMTAMDEIMFKTPDALFSGDAVANVIKSCIPSISDPWLINQLDIDYILISLRIATYGQKLPVEFKCSKCGEINKSDMNLSESLDYYHHLKWNGSLKVNDVTINFQPSTYKKQTEIALQTYTLQKQLSQVSTMHDEEQQKQYLNELMDKINKVKYDHTLSNILSVEYDSQTITDHAVITEWIKNADTVYFNKIQKHLDAEYTKWKLPSQKAACTSCEHVNTVEGIGFDNSNFFESP